MTAPRERPVDPRGRRPGGARKAGRHTAARRAAQAPRRSRWRVLTAGVLVGGVGFGGYLYRDAIPTHDVLDAFAKPASARVVDDGIGHAETYLPQAPSVADAQTLRPTSRNGDREPLDATIPGGASGSQAPAGDVNTAGSRAGATPVPDKSGKGRRIVFSQTEQRVWLVGKDGRIARTYPVSGSTLDNLKPGSYEVYSRSRNAISYDYGSTMEYFVRFTRGVNAPIGFHTIPVDNDGKVLQTRGQLGRPMSSGCIRQRPVDAIALWKFAPIGTKVVVVS